MRRTLNILGVFIFSLFLLSCEKDEDKIDYTAVGQMAGQWYVQLLDDKGSDALGRYVELVTSNTGTNSADSLIVSDLGNIASHGFNVKTKVSLGNKSFSIDKGQNYSYYKPNSKEEVYANYDIKISITNGKISTASKKLPSGTMSDEISFNIEFSDEPGVIYTIKGFRVSGFIEDKP